jgi:CRISPR-associated protein Cmx8
MARVRAKPAPESITIAYDLFDLPTAQHKAGLAGLLFQIDHLNERRPMPPTPRVIERTATTATIEFTAETMQGLMDNVYDAQVVVVRVKSKWNNAKECKPPEEVEEEIEEKGPDGKPRKKMVKVKYYFYEQIQPCGHALRQYLPAMDPQKDWHKLWRDMIWAVPRNSPRSREPFEQRAANPKQPCKEGASSWADLLKVVDKRNNNEFHTVPVAGSLWLGAQATNADSIAFEGRAEQTLLLHFWPLVTQVFVPAVLKVERSEGKVDVKSEFVGYVLAIPEICDLEAFQSDYKTMLGGLSTTMRGFRPAQAVIDLPAEAALSFLAHLGTQKAVTSETRHALGSIEYMHQVKTGNNIKTQTAGRLAFRRHLMEDYEYIVGQDGKQSRFGSPLFRRGLMQAMLDESLTLSQWYRPFGRIFAEWDASFFVPTDAPPRLSWFWKDARKQLRTVEDRVKTDEPDVLPDEDDLLAATVKRLVGSYLDIRLKKDGGFDFAKFRETKKTPQDAIEARRKLAERLFLELRSRREQAFVDHFTNTFFSVGQYLGHKPAPKMFERVAKALMKRTEDVKTLTLMALSANGWVPTPKKETIQ